MKKKIIIIVIIKAIVIIWIIYHHNYKQDDLKIIGNNVDVFIEERAIALNLKVLDYKKNDFIKLRYLPQNEGKPESKEIDSYLYINFDKVKYYRIVKKLKGELSK